MKCSRKNVINTTGTFVISLDFELAWGAWPGEESGKHYKDSILGARIAIPLMLKLFAEYEIHATWATVGLLFFKNRKDLLEGLPSIKPDYVDKRLSVYNRLNKVGENEQDDPYHYGASLIEKIKATPHQEVGSHTFSHYYCLEEGQNIDLFKSDLDASSRIAAKRDVVLKSIVYPQNQFNVSYNAACKVAGITSVRGNPDRWIYNLRGHESVANLLNKGLRFAGTYFNIFDRNCYSIKQLSTDLPLNIRWSRFLRPYSRRLRIFEPLKRHRIKSDLTYAAKKGLVYHLWWHPYNFGINIKENISMLRDILSHYEYLNQKYGMVSLNLNEFVKLFESML